MRMRDGRQSIARIAHELGRHQATIYRELRRNFLYNDDAHFQGYFGVLVTVVQKVHGCLFDPRLKQILRDYLTSLPRHLRQEMRKVRRDRALYVLTPTQMHPGHCCGHNCRAPRYPGLTEISRQRLPAGNLRR